MHADGRDPARRLVFLALDPQAAAGLAGVVLQALLLAALDGDEIDVAGRAHAGDLVGVHLPADRGERGQVGVEQDLVQVGDVDPETTTLAAAVDDAVIAGDLRELDGTPGAIHDESGPPSGTLGSGRIS